MKKDGPALIMSDNVTYRYKAELIKTTDGDTVILKVDVGFRITTIDRFRLAGINAPELNQAGGAKSRDYLISILSGRVFEIESYKPLTDKYGRWLCTIWVEGKNINQEMVRLGLAQEYHP